MKKLMAIIAVVFLLAAGSTFVSAEEEGNVVYSYGEIVEVGPDSITIVEYDFETDQETQNAYLLTEEVELENVGSVKDLKAGDEIDLEYTEADGKKSVSYIYLYPEGEEE